MEKQSAVRVSRLSSFAFLDYAGMHSTLLTGFSVAGLFGGLQSIKFLDASQFRFCLLYGNGVGKPESRALQRVSSVFFCEKGLLYMGFAQ